MDSKKLKDILNQHKMWLTGEEGGKCADLCGANLRGADLYGANLRGANLCDANLYGANLRDVWNIELAQNLFYPICCPEKGTYIGWKKAGELIVELEITDDALRSSATGRKCRASKARVLSITSVDGTKAAESICSDYNKEFIYRVGETVEVDHFEMNRWNECAPGIHHYIT